MTFLAPALYGLGAMSMAAGVVGIFRALFFEWFAGARTSTVRSSVAASSFFLGLGVALIEAALRV